MLKSFLAFRKAKDAESEALFLSPGWARPASLSKPPNEDDYVLWSEVRGLRAGRLDTRPALPVPRERRPARSPRSCLCRCNPSSRWRSRRWRCAT